MTIQDAPQSYPGLPPMRVSGSGAVTLPPAAKTSPGENGGTLHLPSALAKDADELAASIIARHGGPAAMATVDYEIVASMVRLFSAMRAAAPGDLPRLVDSLAKLEGMLPSPATSSRSPLDNLNNHIATTHGAPS